MPLLAAQRRSVKFTGYQVMTTGKQNSRKTVRNEATMSPNLFFQELKTRGHSFLTNCSHASSSVPLYMKHIIIIWKPTTYTEVRTNLFMLCPPTCFVPYGPLSRISI
jgi:hypothetical protein